ncbi:hypothetical protein AALP_AAs73216U000200 [Arabis alpina]|uniref:Uncharacterized protein n=1 Tax=Arabis alpina TaxID=50452 RepID=A0A087G0C6_ARAAL|nr:hypothetical protein AALP_AAs73216U000200 [Arabis alpina]
MENFQKIEADVSLEAHVLDASRLLSIVMATWPLS